MIFAWSDWPLATGVVLLRIPTGPEMLTAMAHSAEAAPN
jgi:hypothetical protein